MPDPFCKSTVGRLSGRFQNPPFDVVKPTVLAAAQPPIFEVPKLEGGPAMRAAQREKTQPATIVAKKNEIFAQQSSSQRMAFQFTDKRDRVPVAAQHLAAWRPRTDSGQRLIFFETQRHGFPFRNL